MEQTQNVEPLAELTPTAEDFEEATIRIKSLSQLEIYGSDCKVLAASFKNAEQVQKCASVGCHSVTVTDDILKMLISHPMTDAAITGFEKDWKSVYGDKQIIDF